MYSDVAGLEGRLHEGVLSITLNRPGQLNALTGAMVVGLTAWVKQAGSDDAVRVISITGAGRAFCSGDDIVTGPEGDGLDFETLRLDLLNPARRSIHYELVRTMLGTPKPIVAAINGRCHGAGWVITLASDFRVARRDALIGDIRAQKAIFANQGVGLLLPRLVGQSRAMELLATGRVMDCEEAQRIGLVVRAWEPDSYEDGLAAFLRDLAEGPTITIAAWKLSITRSVLLELDGYTDFERWLDIRVFESNDLAEGARSFIERRPPRFTGS